MQIYWIRAQAPRRALAVAKHLGLDVEYIEKDLMAGEMKKPDYAALNPNMKAPTLIDGEFLLWESSAIMAYLSAKAGADLWPLDHIADRSRSCVGYPGMTNIGHRRSRHFTLSTS
jgi:glutathione S-transferase